MQTDSIMEALFRLEQEYPGAKTELRFDTPFQLLVATILSAQSTDVQVNKITAKLFKKYPGPKEFAKLTPLMLEQEIKGVGLYRNKSKNIIGASNIIVHKYGGNVPHSLDELIRLPGVGRKTANVVLANAFGQPAIAVDTHVFRVSNRIGLADSKTPEGTELALQKAIPLEKWSQAHHWLIYHGRRVCHARKPNCHECCISDLCVHFNKKDTTGEDTN
ncbi:MAG: endonuclease III [Bacillota bacterium]